MAELVEPIYKNPRRIRDHDKRYLETKYQKYIKPSEWALMKWWLENRLQSPPSRLAIYCMAYLGLRIGEAIALKREQFSHDFSRLKYTPLKKRGLNTIVVHEIVVHPTLQEKLIQYNREHNCHYREGHMFYPFKCQSLNLHIADSTIHWIFKRMTDELKLNDVYYQRKNNHVLRRISPHTLRHFFAWNFYKAAGNDMKATQERLCHEKFETIAIYVNALKAGDNEVDIVNRMVM